MFAHKAYRTAWGERLAAIRDRRDFDLLALELFRWQARRNQVYAGFLRRLGVAPERLRAAREIPAIPQELFKHRTLFCHPAARARYLYLTSGTTTGKSGRQRLLDADLYRLAALRAVAALGPFRGRPRPLPLFFLAASPRRAPHSSLSAMFGFFQKEWGTVPSPFFVGDGTLQLPRLLRALEQAAEGGKPVGLLGTAFSFVHLLDGGGPRLRLPAGSFLLETGGFKGRSRELAKPDLYRALAARLGVPVSAIWNEYGMTELSSQAYAHGIAGEHRAPPWARVLIIDPATGGEVPVGGRGLVRWIDLANVDGVLALETQDLAVRTRTGFRLIGRLPQVPLRGCSLDAEELEIAS